MEALQLLKCSLKKERLNFMVRWPTSEAAMSGVSQPSNDLLSTLFVGDPDAALDIMLNDFSTGDHKL